MTEASAGRYTGELILKPLCDGQRMKVLQDFGFLEDDGLHWPVPPGTIVDGASIPRALWTLIGGPWDGKYRDASVVHDYYCSVRSADWKSVHRVFYRAMRVSKVAEWKAKVMYAAVYLAGPKWSDMDVHNVRLGPPAVPTKIGADLFVWTDPTTESVCRVIVRGDRTAVDWLGSITFDGNPQTETVLRLDALAEIVRQSNPSLKQLDVAIDTALAYIPGAMDSPKAIAVGNLQERSLVE